jgi:hypothetical protein
VKQKNIHRKIHASRSVVSKRVPGKDINLGTQLIVTSFVVLRRHYEYWCHSNTLGSTDLVSVAVVLGQKGGSGVEEVPCSDTL